MTDATRRDIFGGAFAATLISAGGHPLQWNHHLIKKNSGTVAPGVPTITIGSPTSDSLTLSITKGTGDTPTTYLIQRSPDGSSGWATIFGSPVTYTTPLQLIVNAGLVEATSYYYRASATNSAGTSSWSSVVSDTTGSLIAGYTDGASAALVATIPYPTLLAGYAAIPPWQSPGIHYGVGVPTGTVLVPWTSVTGTGISLNMSATPPYMRVDSQTGFILDSIDFTTGGGGGLMLVGCNNTIIRKCKFGGSSAWSTGPLQGDASSSGLTLQNCTVNGSSTGHGDQNESTLIFWNGTGTILFEYNWFLNQPQHVVEFVNSVDVTLRYNLIDSANISHLAHENWLQFNAGTCSAVVHYNTAVQLISLPDPPGEGFQFYFNASGTMTNAAMTNNVMICKAPGQMSYMLHGGPVNGTPQATDNYFDQSGAAYGIWYPGSFSGWTRTGNINMITGAAANS